MHHTQDDDWVPVETALAQNFTTIDENTAIAFHDRVLHAIDAQKAQESQANGTKVVIYKTLAMKPESVYRPKTPSPKSSLTWSIWYTDESQSDLYRCVPNVPMAKIDKLIKSEVFKTVAETFEGAVQSSYSDSNEGLKWVMFIIVKHALPKVLRANRGRIFEDIQPFCLMQL